MDAYSGFIPTITALGVPHSTFWPVWLLRQTITMFFAEGGAAFADALIAALTEAFSDALCAASDWGPEADEGARWQLVKPASVKTPQNTAIKRFVI
jgi:hypothetical protein